MVFHKLVPLPMLLEAHKDGLGGESMSQGGGGGGGVCGGICQTREGLCPMRQGGGSMCQTRGYVSN